MQKLLQKNVAEMSMPTIRRFQEKKSLDDKEMRVYAGWLNWKLNRSKRTDRRHIDDVVEDLADGVALCQVAEVLTGKTLKFNSKAAMTPQQMDNCSVALKCMAENLGLADIDPRVFVGRDGHLVLGFLWQLVQTEMTAREVTMVKPASDIYKWVREYTAGYPGVPQQDMEPRSFKDGRVLNFMLHRACPEAVDLEEMEVQTAGTRLATAIKGAKNMCGVPMLVTADTLMDPNLSEHMLLTYLFAFRTCVSAAEAQGGLLGEEFSSKTPRDLEDGKEQGKFDTLRGGQKQTRQGLPVFQAGPEHEGIDCPVCSKQLLKSGLLVQADDVTYHNACFVCQTCSKTFEEYYWPYQGQPYCLDHYLEVAGLVCDACHKQIREDALLVHGRKYHSYCFTCYERTCSEEFLTAATYNLFEGKPYCDVHYKDVAGVTCSGCGLPVEGEQPVRALGGLFHQQCFACHQCDIPILQPGGAPRPFLADGGRALCEQCHQSSAALPSSSCTACLRPPRDCVVALGSRWCSACFVCTGCQEPFQGSFYNVDGRPYDEKCAKAL